MNLHSIKKVRTTTRHRRVIAARIAAPAAENGGGRWRRRAVVEEITPPNGFSRPLFRGRSRRYLLPMKAVDHLKTLCSLGLPPESAMIAIIPLLHEIVPHGWCRTSLFESDCSCIAVYSENPAAYASFRHVWSFMDDPTALASVGMASFHAVGIGWTLHRQGRGYLESAYYREIEAPVDSCWVLDAWIGDEGRTIAGVQLTRPRSARPFTAEDVQRLDRLRPWLAHALRRNPVTSSTATAPSFTLSAPVLNGQMILTPGAKPLFQSPEMDFLNRIMNGAAHFVKSANGRWATPRQEIPLPVQKLVQRLLDAAEGSVNCPPRIKLSTDFGVLTLEAKWLTPACAVPGDVARNPKSSVIVVTIELREHPIAHAARVLRESGATPTQTQVGIKLALGKNKPMIANELGIQVSSVADLTKKLYQRLDIHNAAELGVKIWLEGPPR